MTQLQKMAPFKGENLFIFVQEKYLPKIILVFGILFWNAKSEGLLCKGEWISDWQKFYYLTECRSRLHTLELLIQWRGIGGILKNYFLNHFLQSIFANVNSQEIERQVM